MFKLLKLIILIAIIVGGYWVVKTYILEDKQEDNVNPAVEKALDVGLEKTGEGVEKAGQALQETSGKDVLTKIKEAGETVKSWVDKDEEKPSGETLSLEDGGPVETSHFFTGSWKTTGNDFEYIDIFEDETCSTFLHNKPFDECEWENPEGYFLIHMESEKNDEYETPRQFVPRKKGEDLLMKNEDGEVFLWERVSEF